ncbi:hypothetical protein OG470_20475 [Micromonospora sp. NBC_00389]
MSWPKTSRALLACAAVMTGATTPTPVHSTMTAESNFVRSAVLYGESPTS